MKTKTIRLSDSFRLHNGRVEVISYDASKEWDDFDAYLWLPSKYRVGAEVMLVSFTDVSPNALRTGHSNVDRYELRFDSPDGIGGNSDQNILRYHGWRGTTNDISCHAHGLRRITKIRELKNGVVSVTVGHDLKPHED